MAFVKKTWLARLGQGLNKFIFNGGSKVTLESSPDTVTQAGTPLSADNMNDLEQRIADEFSNVNSAINAIMPTLLWTNPNSSVDFETQDVSATLSNYRFALVMYKETKSGNSILVALVNLESQLWNTFSGLRWSGANMYPFVRQIRKKNSSTLSFSDSYYSSSTDYTSAKDNSYAIPLYVFGIK